MGFNKILTKNKLKTILAQINKLFKSVFGVILKLMT